jgi:LysM repeat protein
VEAGDTLFGIALQANITLQALLTANNMQEEDFLQIGQVLILPGRTTPLRATGTAAAASAPLTATVTATRTTVAATGSITTTRPATTTVAATAAATTPSLLPTPTPRAAAVTPAATTAGPSVHIVADGETIITIALEYDLDWQELLTLNGMGPDSILQIGQEIRLR